MALLHFTGWGGRRAGERPSDIQIHGARMRQVANELALVTIPTESRFARLMRRPSLETQCQFPQTETAHWLNTQSRDCRFCADSQRGDYRAPDWHCLRFKVVGRRSLPCSFSGLQLESSLTRGAPHKQSPRLSCKIEHVPDLLRQGLSTACGELAFQTVATRGG